MFQNDTNDSESEGELESLNWQNGGCHCIQRLDLVPCSVAKSLPSNQSNRTLKSRL